MKLISKIILLTTLSHGSYAGTVYGLDNMNRLKPSHFKNTTYVQMGSFINPNGASQFQKHLKTKTNYPVLIKHTAGKYQVRVGPFHDYASLKQFADHLSLVTPKKQASSHVQRTIAKAWHRDAVEVRAARKKAPMTTEAIKTTHRYIPTVSSSSWFVNGQIGGQKPQSGSAIAINNGIGLPPPSDRDIYTNNGTKMNPLLGVQAGRRWEFSNKWLTAASLGAQYQYFFASSVNGQVIQFSLPEFTNYSYQWQMGSNLILANGKLNFINYKRFSPYFSAGVGAVVNSNQEYTESAYPDVTARNSPDFQGNSNGQFAYTLGTGIDYRFSPELLLNAGYQYSNLGSLGTGYGINSWSSQSLNLGRYQSNAFLLGLTYLFDVKTHIPFTK